MKKCIKFSISLIISIAFVLVGVLCYKNVNVSAESSADNIYTYDEYNTTYKGGSAIPTDNDGTDTIFAGWYKDETFNTPVYTTDTFNGEGNLYAKFVDKEILSMALQMTAGTNAESTFTNIRFLTSVDSMYYESVGFVINGVEKTSNTVYSTISEYKNEAGNSYSPCDIFSKDSWRFAAYNLSNATNEAEDEEGNLLANATEMFGWSIEVVPQWKTLDGTVVQGDAWTFEINDFLYEAEINDTLTGATDGTEHCWYSFTEAVALANENGETGESGNTVVINLNGYNTFNEITLTKQIAIRKNVQINSPRTKVTLYRGEGYDEGNMFSVSDLTEAGQTQTLTLGANDSVKGASLVVDANGGENAIEGRTVFVCPSATFVLGSNATLQNAYSSSDGAAIINQGTTELWGTIDNNKSSGGAGGVCQGTATGTITIKSGNYTNNKNESSSNAASKRGGFIRAQGSATGIIHIEGGTFSGNEAYQGGVIGTVAGQQTQITGGTFEKNKATGAGGVIILVNNTTTTIKNAKITENEAPKESTDKTGGGAIVLLGTSSITLEGADVSGNTKDEGAQCDIAFISNAQNAVGNLYLKGYEYFDGIVGWYQQANNTSANVITQDADGTEVSNTAMTFGKSRYISYLGDTPALVSGVAQFDLNDRGYYFNTLKDAVDYVNATDGIGGTGDASAVVIDVLDDITLSATVDVKKNIQIQNASGKDVTIGRGTNDKLMFRTPEVTDASGNILSQTLTLGSSDVTQGSLSIDGTYTEDDVVSTSSKRMVDVRSIASEFVLEANATLENATSSANGAVIVNLGTTTLKGTIQNNTCTNTSEDSAGAILMAYDSSKVDDNKPNYTLGTLSIIDGEYKNNISTNGRGGLIGAQTYGGDVKINGGIFSGNQAGKGGVVYVRDTQQLTVGRSVAEASTFTGNTATAGGVFYIDGCKNNTNISYASFTGNTAAAEAEGTVSGGGAIFISGYDNDNYRVTLREAVVSGNTAEGKSTCDIVFDNKEKTMAGLLRLKAYSEDSVTFDGIIGWYGRAQVADTPGTATVKLVDKDDNELCTQLLDYGTRYNVVYNEGVPAVQAITE